MDNFDPNTKGVHIDPMSGPAELKSCQTEIIPGLMR